MISKEIARKCMVRSAGPRTPVLGGCMDKERRERERETTVLQGPIKVLLTLLTKPRDPPSGPDALLCGGLRDTAANMAGMLGAAESLELTLLRY